MSQYMKQTVLKKFEQIPGVGKKISMDLWGMGLRSVEDLKDNDPEKLYSELCEKQRVQVEPELLKWWNWKDDKWRKNDENSFTAA